MDKGKWYTVEKMGLELFDKIPPKNNLILRYNKSWDKEYFFKKEEINKIKKRVNEMKSDKHFLIATNFKILGEIIPIKENNKESRLKRLSSIKFITDEI